MKIRCSYYGGSLIHDMSLLFDCFQDSLFVIFFKQFEYDVSWYGCLSFYPYLEFIELLGCVGYVFHQIWVFGHYFFQIFVLPLSSSSGTLLIVFFPCIWVIFSCFSICFILFCWKLGILNIIMWQLWKSDFPLFPGFVSVDGWCIYGLFSNFSDLIL